MTVTGSMIGAALGLGSSLYGGLKASEAMKSVKNNVLRQKQRNEEWFERKYNEDATQRADAQRLLQITAENIRKRNEQARGRAAVMGGTEESVAATKEANAQALASAASTIAANGAKDKDRIEREYHSRQDALDNQLNKIEQNRAAAITQAMGGVANAAMKAGLSVDEVLNGVKKQ